MKKQYRIINKGKGVLKITSSNLNEVEQPLTEIEALYDYVNNQDGEVLFNSKAYTNNSLITINTNITELEDKIALLELPNEILTRGAVVLVDNAIKILPYAFTVRINQKRLSNPLAYSVPINPTTIGYNRIDIITIDSFGIFTKLQGEESLSTAIKPQPLADTLEVTSINITGNVISPPVVTDTAKLDRGGYTGGSAMTLYQEITALDEAITTRIDDIVYEVVEISLPLKEDKNQKGVANGYVPLNEFTKIALQYLNVVNNLVDGGTNSLLTAEQGKQLQLQVSAIQNILFSDNVNLDTIQEIVDALETVQSYIDTILVNDLTTGGTTKALTAEMGKLLQTNKVDKVTGKSLISDSEITRLATVTNYTHPTNHPPSIITQDANNRFVTDAERSTWNDKQGALGFTPENVSNKQNSLAVDGTNTKYPTVTAINTGLDLKANLNHPGLTGNVKTTGDQGVSGEKFFSSVINFTKTTIAARYEGPINLNINTLTSSVYAGACVIGSLNGSFAFASGNYGRAIFSTFNIGTTARTFTLPDKNGTVAMISDIPVALSGSYTPIVTINSNLSALSTSGAVWTRVDKIVTVTVSIDFTGTNAYTDTGFSISVPIPMSLQNTVALRNLGLATFITPLVPAICTNVQEDFPNVNINFFIESVIHSYTGTVTFSYILP